MLSPSAVNSGETSWENLMPGGEGHTHTAVAGLVKTNQGHDLRGMVLHVIVCAIVSRVTEHVENGRKERKEKKIEKKY